MHGGGDEWLWFRGRPRLCRLMSCCLPTIKSTSPINAKLMGIRLAAAAAPTLITSHQRIEVCLHTKPEDLL